MFASGTTESLVEGITEVSFAGELMITLEISAPRIYKEVIQMGNLQHIEPLKQGSEVWNRWRSAHRTTRPDFSKANLAHIDLRNANLNGADLNEACLTAANLMRATLWEALCKGTIFHGAHFHGAALRRVDLSETDLEEVNLDGAALY
jgi:hypothetical protein